MSADAVPAPVRRRRRAFAARQLLAAHAEGALEEPSRWDWDTLGELPPWCLLGEADRRRLQALCGLLFLGPELRSMLDGAVLRAAGELVGEGALERALDDALARFEPARETAVRGGESALAACGEEVAERLLGIGASVLYATLGERLESVLPLESLREAVGPALGTLERSVAERVLERAETLFADGEAPRPGAARIAASGDRGAAARAPAAPGDDADPPGAMPPEPDADSRTVGTALEPRTAARPAPASDRPTRERVTA